MVYWLLGRRNEDSFHGSVGSLGVPMSPILVNERVRSALCDPADRSPMVSSPQNAHTPMKTVLIPSVYWHNEPKQYIG
jgi:hypothetical protein